VDTFEGVYFANYTNQGGFNQKHELTFSCPSTESSRTSVGTYLSTNDRPGYEINERVRHTEAGGNAGIVLRLASKVDLMSAAARTTYRYQEEDDASIYYSETLDRRTENYGAQLRYKLTSLTTLNIPWPTACASATRRPRTGTTTATESSRGRVRPVSLLIKARRRSATASSTRTPRACPTFPASWRTSSCRTSFLGRTRFRLAPRATSTSSYDIDEPFYIQPGFTLSVTQQVGGPWDVQARGSWYG